MTNDLLERIVLKQALSKPDILNGLSSSKLDESWFVHKYGDEENSYHSVLFSLAKQYFEESNGLLLSGIQLAEKLSQSSLKESEKKQILTLMTEVESEPGDYHDSHWLINEMRNQKCLRMYKDAITETHSMVSEKGLDEARLHLQAKLHEMDAISESSFLNDPDVNFSESHEYFEEEVNKRREAGDDVGIKCGLPEIDDVTQGWRPGQYVVVVARSSGGKSIVLMNWAAAAHTQGKNVLYFSLEMPVWQCYLRHLSWICRPSPDGSWQGITHKELKGLHFDSHMQNKIVEKLKSISGGAYFIYSNITDEPTVEAIERKMRIIEKEHGRADVVVVDYIGKMTSSRVRKNAQIWERSAEAGIDLDRLCKRYQNVVLTAAQLSKSSISEHRKVKREGKGSLVDMDQDMVSGSHTLVTDASYIFGFDSRREEQQMIFSSIKMREGGWLVPFPCKVLPEYNLVQQMEDENIKEFRQMHGLYTGIASPDKANSVEELSVAPEPYVQETDDGFIEVGAPGGKTQFTVEDLNFESLNDWDTGWEQ